MNIGRGVTLSLLATALAGCVEGEDAYTLYRNSVLDRDMRIHMATFDAADGSSYNAENCRITAELFLKQPGITVVYWCEPGLFRE